MINVSPAQLREFRLKIPDLTENPAIGASCCAYPAFNAIADSLLWLEGVTTVLPTGREDEVLVELDVETGPETRAQRLRAITEDIVGLDYQVTEIVEDGATHG